MDGKALYECLKQVAKEAMSPTGTHRETVKETLARKVEGFWCKEIVKVRFKVVGVGLKHR